MATAYYRELLKGEEVHTEALSRQLDELKGKLLREGELLPEGIPAVAVDTPCDPFSLS